jgi:hypothetical protein
MPILSVMAEIGRKQHRPPKQVLDRRTGHTQREATAGGVAEQRNGRVRIALPHESHEVGHVVLELTEIADIAAHARAAMAADVGCKGLDAMGCQCIGERVHRRARARGTVNEDGDQPGRRPARRIVSVRQQRAVAGTEVLQPRHGAAIYGFCRLRDGAQLGERGKRRRNHCGQNKSGGADNA